MPTDQGARQEAIYKPHGAPITVTFFMSALRGSWYFKEFNGPTRRDGITDDAARDEVTLLPEKLVPGSEYHWRLVMFGPATKTQYAAGVEIKQGRRLLAEVKETGELARQAKSLSGILVFVSEE